MMVAHAQAEGARLNVPKDKYELQMIYEFGATFSNRSILRATFCKSTCPSATDWCPYFMRRLSERPANCWFVLRSLLAESGAR